MASIKEAAGGEGPQWSLALEGAGGVRLRVVPTQPGRVLDADVEVLTRWRNRFVTSFLTEFEATPARTAEWLQRVVGPDNSRILFMVEAPDGVRIGYMGLAFIDWGEGYGEADAVVRGVDGWPGIMGTGLRALLGWARFALGLRRIGVRVRSDNPALGWYVRLGFREIRREALRRSVSAGMVSWVPDGEQGAAEVFLVHMDWPEVE